MIGKTIKEKFRSGITLTNNEMIDIMKVLKFYYLLKGTTRKITSQEEDFQIFLDH